MGGDPDNDGDLDIFVTNITGESHAFYENRGGGLFHDRRVSTRLGVLTRPYTGFGTEWLDCDTDGLLDLFVANGAVTILEALRGDAQPFRQANQLLRNLGGHFQDISGEAGAVFGAPEVSRGAAFGDIDNDGDVDVLVTNNGGPVRLLMNDSSQRHKGVSVRLQGIADNTQGLGARVGLLRLNGTTLWRRAHTDGSYLSASDPRVHFGGVDTTTFVSFVVEWPRGGREVWSRVATNRVVTLKQGTGKIEGRVIDSVGHELERGTRVSHGSERGGPICPQASGWRYCLIVAAKRTRSVVVIHRPVRSARSRSQGSRWCSGLPRR